MAARQKNIVLFDFDGTIVSKNTGSEFYKWMARKSLLRVIILTLLVPILVPLRVFSFFTSSAITQKLGLNIVCLVSTSFLDTPLYALRRSFINYYLSRCGAVVHQDAIRRIHEHQANGDHVVIISGCPEWILHGLAKTIGIRGATLIGSKVSFSAKGILLDKHCYQSNKVSMARARGIDLSRCSHGYSDSVTDLPILAFCENMVMVNANPLDKIYLRLFHSRTVTFEQWRQA